VVKQQLQAKERELQGYEKLMVDSRKSAEAAATAQIEAQAEATRLTVLNDHFEAQLENARREVTAALKAKRAMESDMETFERVKAERDALEEALLERSKNHNSLVVSLSEQRLSPQGKAQELPVQQLLPPPTWEGGGLDARLVLLQDKSFSSSSEKGSLSRGDLNTLRQTCPCFSEDDIEACREHYDEVNHAIK